jgi:hypothetical protein
MIKLPSGQVPNLPQGVTFRLCQLLILPDTTSTKPEQVLADQSVSAVLLPPHPPTHPSPPLRQHNPYPSPRHHPHSPARLLRVL